MSAVLHRVATTLKKSLVFGSIITTANSHKMSLSTKAELFFYIVDIFVTQSSCVPTCVSYK